MDETQKTTPRNDALPGSVLVVEDDSTLQAGLVKTLKEYGCPMAEGIDNAQAAWELLQKKTFECLVIDWKMSPMTGAQLLHRVRAKKETQDTAVLVVSGYMTRRDFRFAEEYMFTALLEKPFENFFFIRRIKDLIKDRRWFESEKDRIEALISSFPDGAKAAMPVLLEMLDKAPRPVPITLATARTLIEKNDLKHSTQLLQRLLERDPECVVALTLLGKIYLKQKRFYQAAQTLEQAHKLSPENPERLCMLGDATLNMFDVEKAEEYFTNAQNVDPNYDRANAGVALARNVGAYLSQYDLSRMPPSFASLLNSIGISMVRTGKFKEGMEHYQSAMQYVENDIFRSQLAFNLGLGFMRWKKEDQAAEWFDKAFKLSKGKMSKAADHLKKLGKSVSAPLEFDIAEEHLDADAESLFKADSKAPANVTEEAKPLPPPLPTHGPDDTPPPPSPVDAAPQPGLDPTGQDQMDTIIIRIQTVLSQVVMPDPSLFAATGTNALRKSHEAYLGNFEGQSIAVLVPGMHRPKNLAKADQLATMKSLVIAFRKEAGVWVRIWPQAPAKVA